MLVHRAFAKLRRVVPGSVSRSLRAAATAILTPFHFARSTGHFRSSLHSKALDATGHPIPWYTYPAVELLRNQTFAGRRVLEFGAGQSTLWWADKANAVVSYEDNADWFAYIRDQLPPNATVHLTDSLLSEFDPAGSFDLIIIDGLDRMIATAKSVSLLAPNGALLLDNSEGYWGPEGTYPIIAFLRDKGFQRVDFYGFSPGNMLQHCTSIFFRDRCFLFEGTHAPTSLGTLERFLR